MAFSWGHPPWAGRDRNRPPNHCGVGGTFWELGGTEGPQEVCRWRASFPGTWKWRPEVGCRDAQSSAGRCPAASLAQVGRMPVPPSGSLLRVAGDVRGPDASWRSKWASGQSQLVFLRGLESWKASRRSYWTSQGYPGGCSIWWVKSRGCLGKGPLWCYHCPHAPSCPHSLPQLVLPGPPASDAGSFLTASQGLGSSCLDLSMPSPHTGPVESTSPKQNPESTLWSRWTAASRTPWRSPPTERSYSGKWPNGLSKGWSSGTDAARPEARGLGAGDKQAPVGGQVCSSPSELFHKNWNPDSWAGRIV